MNDERNKKDFYCEGKEMSFNVEKQGEQKPIDEVKPKFKVGDWVVYDGWTTQIKEVYEDGYSNIHQGFIPKKREEEMHLWTIQDAKDGDVLATKNPFIFRGFGDEPYTNSPTAYCGIASLDTFILSIGNNRWTANDVHPATKEQRDLLFQKMKKAGYEWDAKNKKLKKIEQNPAWSEEDEKMCESTINVLVNNTMSGSEGDKVYSEEIDWLKSLKERIINDKCE